MNDNIQIINKTGEEISTEGLTYIEIPSTTKKYVFYTLNEKVDNDLTKIYISETNPETKVENSISDAEWEDLRQKMIKISHKEEVEDVNYLIMNDVKFNVGDPKKLAITAGAKQAFKDAQLSHTMATNQTATPVTDGDISPFFNQDVAGVQDNLIDTVPAEENIFSNPPQPEMVSSEPANEPAVPTSESIVSSEQTPVVQENVAVTGDTIPAVESTVPQMEMVNQLSDSQVTPNSTAEEYITPMEEPVKLETPVAQQNENEPVIPTEQTMPSIEEVLESTPLNTLDGQAMNDNPVDKTVVEPIQEISTSSGKGQIITDEEALKAINTIQEYINQESENNNQ